MLYSGRYHDLFLFLKLFLKLYLQNIRYKFKTFMLSVIKVQIFFIHKFCEIFWIVCWIKICHLLYCPLTFFLYLIFLWGKEKYKKDNNIVIQKVAYCYLSYCILLYEYSKLITFLRSLKSFHIQYTKFQMPILSFLISLSFSPFLSLYVCTSLSLKFRALKIKIWTQ